MKRINEGLASINEGFRQIIEAATGVPELDADDFMTPLEDAFREKHCDKNGEYMLKFDDLGAKVGYSKVVNVNAPHYEPPEFETHNWVVDEWSYLVDESEWAEVLNSYILDKFQNIPWTADEQKEILNELNADDFKDFIDYLYADKGIRRQAKRSVLEIGRDAEGHYVEEPEDSVIDYE